MRKKILLFFSAAMLSVFPSLARDFEYTDEGGQTLIYTVLDEDAKTCETRQGSYDSSTKTATPGNSVSGKLVIPSLVSDGESNYTVTQIGTNGFPTCEITEVEFPNTLLIINNYAFQDCPLKDVILPLSVETVSNNAFQRCPIVKYAAKKSFYALSNCFKYAEGDIVENGFIYSSDRSELIYASAALEGEISLPDGLTSIGESAFSGCSGLSSTSLPDGLTSIGNYAFKGCSGLSSISLPEGLTSIGESAFSGCSGLSSISLPEGLTSIGESVFSGCSGLSSISLPDDLTSIGESLFSGCSGLSSISLPDGLTSIGESAFSGCSGLNSISIPGSVNSIGNFAFNECNGLKTLRIEYGSDVLKLGVNKIGNGYDVYGNGLFYDCPLESLYLGRELEYLSSWDGGRSPFYTKATLETLVFGESVTSIGNSAFEDCSGLSSISLPDGLTSIGNSAFKGCSGLSSISLPDGLTSIGYSAFEGCSGLSSISLPDGITSIGSSTFSGCSGLNSISMPDGITLIYDSAFKGCSGLSSISLPNELTYIGYFAFSGCSGLTSVIIPPSVTYVPRNSFDNCDGLIKSAYPNTIDDPFLIVNNGYVTGSHGFSVVYNHDGAIVEDGWVYGPNKESIYFAPIDLEGECIAPESVTSIGYSAFEGCSGLTSISFFEGLTSIGAYAFKDCSKLTSISLPDGLISIGESAFERCGSLTSVILPPSVTNVSKKSFDYCYGLIKSAYPNTISNPFRNGKCVSYNPDGAIVEDGWIYGPNKESIYFAPLDLEGEYVAPESVSSIGEYAFYGCSGLTTIILPPSVTSVGKNAFDDCSGLIKSACPKNVRNSVSCGNWAAYEPEGVIFEDGWIYGPNKEIIYYAPLDLEGEYTVSESVSSIENNAFAYCKDLTTIVIPSSVSSIGEYAFDECSGLTMADFSSIDHLCSIEFGNAWSNPIYYTKKLYINGEEVKEVNIPDGLTSIGAYTFYGCSGLTSITIPESVTSIGWSAFNGCNLESVKVMTSNPPTIGSSGFDYSTYNSAILDVPQSSFNAYLSTTWNNFKNIYADGYNTSRTYEDGVFKYRLIENPDNREAILIAGDYSELTEGTVPQRFTDESDPANLTRYEVAAIGPDAFKNCTNLKSLSFNSRSTINSIGSSAFEGCSSLTSISFPNTVKTIEQNAFRNCSSLTEISLPLALTSLGDYAFANSGLRKINFNDALETIGAYAFNGTNLTEVNLNDKITSLANYTFADCKNLKSVSLNDGLVKIGQYVFNGCSNLASISIPESVEEIGYRAFYDCTSLKTADFASVADVCKIKFENEYSNPIYYAKKLHINGEEVTELEIPQTVTEIGDCAFYNCAGLTKVVIPNSVTSLGYGVFSYCSGLTDLTVGNSLNEISDQFNGCTSLKSLTLADGVNPIDLSGLDRSSYLTSLYMGREILNANGFSNLETLEVGNAVEEIKDSEFSGCRYLASLSLGGGLTSIGESAFANCVKLAEVVVPQNVETIGASAFAGNTSLSEITMGYAVKTIGEKAFDGCPASIVRITALTPPTAPNNTFSNYTGKLWLQDPGDNSVIDAYYDAYTCWDRFDSYAMIVATDIKYEGDQTLVGNAGDTFSLRATLEPADVTLPQIFWYSTNPAVATVDANGLVTLQKSINEVAALAEGEDYAECKIIGESLYADGPKVEITVNNLETGVDIISGGDFTNNNGAIDYDSPVEVFTLNGMRVASSMENLAPGIYVIRQGSKVEKRMVK